MLKWGVRGCGCVAVAFLFLLCGMIAVMQQSEFQPPVQQLAVAPTATLGAPGPTPEGGSPAAPVAQVLPTVNWINSHGWRVSSPYGWRPSSRPGYWEWHGAVDLAGPQFAPRQPVVALLDGNIFDIRFMDTRYTGGGLCVEMVNDASFEEVPLLILNCHFWPYQIRGYVYDARTGRGVPDAKVWLMSHDMSSYCGPHECGPCDEDRDGEPDFDPANDGGIYTDAQGFWCFDYSTPDGGHVIKMEKPNGDWRYITPNPPTVPFEIRVDEGVTAYDVQINFYIEQPEPEPTATPTPTPSPPPGGGGQAVGTPTPGPQPAGAVVEYNVGPVYVRGWGPPITLHTEIRQNKTVLGYIGWTGRMTGPHLHLEIKRTHDFRINVYTYKRPRYPDGSLVPISFLYVYANPFKDQVDPLQYLPLANDEYGLAYMDQPIGLAPEGHPLAGEGLWWSPSDLYSDGGGGRLHGYTWRWFDWGRALFCMICPCELCPKCSKCGG